MALTSMGQDVQAINTAYDGALSGIQRALLIDQLTHNSKPNGGN